MFDPSKFVASNIVTVEVPDSLMSKLGIPRIVERKGYSSSVFKFPFTHNGKNHAIPLHPSNVEVDNGGNVKLYGNPWSFSFRVGSTVEEIAKAFLKQ